MAMSTRIQEKHSQQRCKDPYEVAANPVGRIEKLCNVAAIRQDERVTAGLGERREGHGHRWRGEIISEQILGESCGDRQY